MGDIGNDDFKRANSRLLCVLGSCRFHLQRDRASSNQPLVRGEEGREANSASPANDMYATALAPGTGVASVQGVR